MIVAVSVIALGTKETSVGGLEAKRVGVLLASARSRLARGATTGPGCERKPSRPGLASRRFARNPSFEPAVERSARIRHVGP